MTCAACVRRVEKALNKIEGVAEASVNFATHTASVRHSATTTTDAMIRAVQGAGYDAKTVTHDDPSEEQPKPAIDLIVAASLSVPLVGVSMFWMGRPEAVNWLLMALGAIVVFGAGRRFFAAAWATLRHGDATMDTLVATGGLSAVAYSLIALLANRGHPEMQAHGLYLESGAVIVTLVLMGRRLEERAKYSLNDAVRKLMKLAPDSVMLVSPDGDGLVPLSSVKPGDLLRLKPGERVGVDGVVVEGETDVDESSFTGEPIPVRKRVGDHVLAGSLNTHGAVVYRAEHVGADTALMRIVDLVRHAQGTRAPMQRLADRVSAVFVPAVVAVALLTLVVRVALGEPWAAAAIPAIAVLVVACPCALGLATPTALVVGVARGAELGVLIKDSVSLEFAGGVRSILLDKTGTLTEGKPKLLEVKGPNPDEALRLAAALEMNSEHPLGLAIVQAAAERGVSIPKVEDFSAHRGKGVSGKVEGRSLSVIAWSEVDRQKRQAAFGDFEPAVGASGFVMLEGKIPFAAFSAGDAVSAHAREAVNRLKALGLRTIMVSGDRRAAAEHVAHEVGVDACEAEVPPERKAELVRRYQAEGLVAMVGDGVNDAPALAQADLGIAMGHGSDIAIDSAGMALLRSDLRGASTAIALARATLGVIRANLGWAFGYNVVMIPLAVAGKLNPMLAALAMSLSSVTVVLNSLRLKRWSPPFRP